MQPTLSSHAVRAQLVDDLIIVTDGSIDKLDEMDLGFSIHQAAAIKQVLTHHTTAVLNTVGCLAAIAPYCVDEIDSKSALNWASDLADAFIDSYVQNINS